MFLCYLYAGLSDIQNINRILMVDQLIFYLMIYKWSSSLHLPINYSRSKSLLCIVKNTYLMLGSRQERLKGCVKSTKTSSDLPTKRLFSLFAAVAVNSNDSDRQQVSLYLVNICRYFLLPKIETMALTFKFIQLKENEWILHWSANITAVTPEMAMS